ncbi:dihydropteroate synthase [Kocuria rhizophila]|nr:dihydropteroate synthase [Kocuria rhizophila]
MPDSFSDGGSARLLEAAAVVDGLRLAEQGVEHRGRGRQFTRPHAQEVDPAEERRRALPVIRELSRHGVVVSVDTFHPDTARAVIEVGAHIVNDVGTAASDEMIELVGQSGVPYVLMHSRGTPQTMTVGHLHRHGGRGARQLTAVRDRLLAAGPSEAARRGSRGWASPRRVARTGAAPSAARLRSSATRSAGSSPQRFLGAAPRRAAPRRPVTQRDARRPPCSALSAFGGAWAVRVHDVPATVDAVAAAHAWRGSSHPAGCPATPRAEATMTTMTPIRAATTALLLTGLGAVGYHGVFEKERRSGQPLRGPGWMTVPPADRRPHADPRTTARWPTGPGHDHRHAVPAHRGPRGGDRAACWRPSPPWRCWRSRCTSPRRRSTSPSDVAVSIVRRRPVRSEDMVATPLRCVVALRPTSGTGSRAREAVRSWPRPGHCSAGPLPWRAPVRWAAPGLTDYLNAVVELSSDQPRSSCWRCARGSSTATVARAKARWGPRTWSCT